MSIFKPKLGIKWLRLIARVKQQRWNAKTLGLARYKLQHGAARPAAAQWFGHHQIIHAQMRTARQAVIVMNTCE